MKKVENTNVFARIANSQIFQRFIIIVIVFAGILVGLETYPDLHEEYLKQFKIADVIIQIIFTIEIVIRILAYGNKPQNFFKSFNNIFDFVITALFYLPLGGAYAAVLRLFRVIRVLRLITALPRLQILVGALIKSLPSMGWISVLLMLQLYVFAVVGCFMFGATDPENFGNLGTAFLTLFQIITLEGWVDIMKAQPQSIWTVLYFLSFILLGTMIVLNLFIGVVINGFEEVKKEIEEEIRAKHKPSRKENAFAEISLQLNDIRQRIDELAPKRK